MMDGVVMGGGMGISQGAKLRVLTEGSKLAMPETHIGLFPDVGGDRPGLFHIDISDHDFHTGACGSAGYALANTGARARNDSHLAFQILHTLTL